MDGQHTIPGRYLAFVLLLLTLGCIAIYAPRASAKPKHHPKPPKSKLLSRRSCKGLLSIGDFPGTVRENAVLSKTPTLFTSECTFFPPEPSELDPNHEGSGFDTLVVLTRKGYEPNGKPLNLLAGSLVPKSPSTQSLQPIHGFGTRAEMGSTNESDRWVGIMQVRNDLFTVQTTEAQVKPLLSKVAHELE